VKALVEAGANTDAIDGDGRTPLHLALIATGNERENEAKLTVLKDIVHYLVASGASTNCLDVSGVSPLHVAAEIGDDELVQCLVEEGGAFVGITDCENETALFYAVRGQHQVVVEQLVRHYKIDINWKNDDGESAIEVMREIRDEKMVGVLSALGATVAAPLETRSKHGEQKESDSNNSCSLSLSAGCSFSWGLVRSVSAGTAC